MVPPRHFSRAAAYNGHTTAWESTTENLPLNYRKK